MANETIQIILEARDNTKDAFRTLTDDMGKANEGGINLGGTFKALTLAAVGVGAALAAATVGISKEAVSQMFDYNDQVHRLTMELGMTVPEASAVVGITEHWGMSVDELSFGLNSFTKNLATANLNTTGTTKTLVDNSKAVDSAKHSYDQAVLSLKAAQDRLHDAKKPTDEMRVAVEKASNTVAYWKKKLDETPATIEKDAKSKTTGVKATTAFDDALQKLGLTQQDIAAGQKDVYAILPKLMDAFKAMPDGVQKSTVALELFNARSGSKMIDILNEGSKGLDKWMKYMADSGIQDKQTSDDVTNLENAFHDLGTGMQKVWVNIGVQLIPVLKDLTSFVNDHLLPGLMSWVHDALPGVIKGFTDLKDTLGKELMPLLQTLADDVKTGNFSKIPQDIGDILKKIWDFAKPALIEFMNNVAAWAESTDTQTYFKQLGGSIGGAVISGFMSALTSVDWGKQILAVEQSSNARNVANAASGNILGLMGIPGFQIGGVVPGPLGAPQLAVVHGGEQIIPAGRSGAVGGGSNVTFVYAPTISLATRAEAQNVLQPFIEKGILNARAKRVGSTA